MKTKIVTKRVYEPELPDDGFRIYVDRLWPRGLSHETFHYDLWDKEVSPSTELRQWFHENPTAELTEFEERYKKELLKNPAYDALKRVIADKPVITLLYSSHDRLHNNALVLQQLLI